MTMNARRRRMHAKLAALPGVRPVRRPVRSGADDRFDLYYVRAGRKSTHPLLLIPGGPGAASVALYRGLRRRAAAAGLDVIMVEHRGVGLSRHDDSGADLPPEAITIDSVVDDIAAVLDSPVLSAADIHVVRDAIRRLLWDGEAAETADLAPKVRRLVDDGFLSPAATNLATALYGFAGPDPLERHLDLLLAGRRRLWSAMERAGRFVFDRKAPYRNEPDLVARIAYRELNYGAAPDGRPLDSAVAYRENALGAPDFVAEPYDLASEMPNFRWPTVVVCGGRDLITPPAVARRIASLIPDAVLVTLATAGHSIVDSRERAALDIIDALYAGWARGLPARSATLDSRPPGLGIRALLWGMAAATALESALPGAAPQTPQRVTS
ncbi:alpha/beta hydrolase [Mycolicibacterium sp. XJ879]